MRLFQLHLMQSGLTIQNRNRTMTGVRFLLRVTMRRLDLAAEIFHMKEPVRVPQILSAGEAMRLLLMAGKLQVRMLFSIGYGAGLRVSEVVKLEVKHIDSALGVIRVEQSKGKKDRQVMLSPETLDLLRECGRCAPTSTISACRLRSAGCSPAAGRGCIRRRGRSPGCRRVARGRRSLLAVLVLPLRRQRAPAGQHQGAGAGEVGLVLHGFVYETVAAVERDMAEH